MKITLRSKLDDYLDSKGIRKIWLAEQLGVHKSYITKWGKNENGIATTLPSVQYLIHMKKILNCNDEDLYEIIELDE
ncbi:helix-turn-helix domain-containing protein [Metabacillus fastidiosus]|uniref:helix-turn-helix domain-containing protein n=1 Tax=Metabacillus fastidiosus TaxID=1458 RepID=UPI003D2E472C